VFKLGHAYSETIFGVTSALLTSD